MRQQPPRCSNITETEAWHDFRFRAEERKLLCPKPLRSLRIPRRVVLCNGSPFHGETALRLPLRRMQHEEGVALLVAHKEFSRARQTPYLWFCSLLLGACMYRTRCQVCCTWNNERLNERLETGSTYNTTSTRIILHYCCTWHIRILQSRTFPFPSSISKASPAGFVLPL